MNSQLTHARSNLPEPAPKKTSADKVLIALSVCMALQITGFVMILPVFSQRFDQLGGGVESLGTSSMAYALAAVLAAPLMGALADRFGRRALMLFSFAAYLLAFIGYRFIESVPALIALRGLAGAFTAGLGPAVFGMVGDLAPKEQRARWIGIVSGGLSVGWIVGPLLGGLIFDRFGFDTVTAVSIAFAAATMITAFATVRGGEPPQVQLGAGKPVHAEAKPASATQSAGKAPFLTGLRGSLPKALPGFILMLVIYFGVMFAWAFIEPKFMFYAYDGLGWSASRLGLTMSVYGVAMTAGEFGLSQLSDRIGRKPVIILGLVLYTAQFLGLALSRNTFVIAGSFILAGLGNALFDPALSAAVIDVSPAGHQSRVMGLKSTAGSLGSILGPGLTVLFDASLGTRGVFMGASATVVLMTLLAIIIPTGSKKVVAFQKTTAKVQAD